MFEEFSGEVYGGLACALSQCALPWVFARALPHGPWSTSAGYTAHPAVALPVVAYMSIVGSLHWFSNQEPGHNTPEWYCGSPPLTLHRLPIVTLGHPDLFACASIANTQYTSSSCWNGIHRGILPSTIRHALRCVRVWGNGVFVHFLDHCRHRASAKQGVGNTGITESTAVDDPQNGAHSLRDHLSTTSCTLLFLVDSCRRVGRYILRHQTTSVVGYKHLHSRACGFHVLSTPMVLGVPHLQPDSQNDATIRVGIGLVIPFTIHFCEHLCTLFSCIYLALIEVHHRIES